jgi:arsenite-transporting ATPase
MRIILFTGKGGVGKTTVSSATAVKCAKMGYKTIVISTDPAHSVSDSLDKSIGQHPTLLDENLYGQEINVNNEIKENWSKIQDFVTKFLEARGFSQCVAEEFSIFPGMEELFSLLKLKEYYEKKAYDVAIIDCAPTASTIRMLSFPDVIGWYMEKFFHIERLIVKTVRPIAEKLSKVPLPTDDVFFSIEELYQKINGMYQILTDQKVSSIRIVVQPEKMVIKESQRAYSYFNLFGFIVDCAIINKVLPDEVEDAYFNIWKKSQKRYIDEAIYSFYPIPVFNVPLYKNEVIGINSLMKMADDIYGDKDPTKMFCITEPVKIYPYNNGYKYEIRLPNVEKTDIKVWRKGEELICELGNFKRNIMLPRILSSLELIDARFTDYTLVMIFK